MTLHLVENVVIPYITHVRTKAGMSEYTLVITDMFKGHTGEKLLSAAGFGQCLFLTIAPIFCNQSILV